MAIKGSASQYKKKRKGSWQKFALLDGQLFYASKLAKAKLPNSFRSDSGNFFAFASLSSFTKSLPISLQRISCQPQYK